MKTERTHTKAWWSMRLSLYRYSHVVVQVTCNIRIHSAYWRDYCVDVDFRDRLYNTGQPEHRTYDSFRVRTRRIFSRISIEEIMNEGNFFFFHRKIHFFTFLFPARKKNEQKFFSEKHVLYITREIFERIKCKKCCPMSPKRQIRFRFHDSRYKTKSGKAQV